MTVRELIDVLIELPADLPVLVHGYEAGYNNAVGAGTICVTPNPSDAWFFGRWTGADDGDDGATQAVIVG